MKKILKNCKETFIGLLLLHLITTFVWIIVYESKYNFTNEGILFTIFMGELIAYVLHYFFFIKMESSITPKNKNEYIKGILVNNIAITIGIELILFILSSSEIILRNNLNISSKIEPSSILFITTIIKLSTSMIYYLLTNKKNIKENKFICIPVGIQTSLFATYIIIDEIYGTDLILTIIVLGIIFFISNFLVLKNRKKLSKKYNIEEDKLCKRFYLIFLFSFLPLFGITLLLIEMGLILTCSGMFCGIDTAAFLFIIFPIIEIVFSIICVFFSKLIRLFK